MHRYNLKRNSDVEKKCDTEKEFPKYGIPRNHIKLRKGDINPKIAYPDGDSSKISPNLRSDRPKINVQMKPNGKVETRLNHHTEVTTVLAQRKILEREAQKRAELEVKRIREKYALKTKSVPIHQIKEDIIDRVYKETSDVKEVIPAPIEQQPLLIETKPTETENVPDVPKRNSAEKVKEKKEPKQPSKKAVIKTIVTEKGSVPIYKAVTFVEKRKKTKLNIKIPNGLESNKQKVSKYTDTSFISQVTVSRASLREKKEVIRKRSGRKREKKGRGDKTAANIRDYRDNRSPSTEVAKWAPSSINQHTEPYYKAWVNRRLAAMSKNRKKDKLYYSDQHLLNNIKKAIEPPSSPELVYSNLSDERSPSTEVAKWAPSSINQHTEPYYKAWVNRRLAAMSKNRKKDKLYYSDQHLLNNIKKAIEPPSSPELVYSNLSDERYTGRIKIRQKM